MILLLPDLYLEALGVDTEGAVGQGVQAEFTKHFLKYYFIEIYIGHR